MKALYTWTFSGSDLVLASSDQSNADAQDFPDPERRVNPPLTAAILLYTDPQTTKLIFESSQIFGSPFLESVRCPKVAADGDHQVYMALHLMQRKASERTGSNDADPPG